MRLRRIGVLIMALAAIASPGAALAAPGNGNSAATITANPFTDSCRDVSFHSSKDISHVEIHYRDRRVVKDQVIHSPDFTIDGNAGDEIDLAVVKSGTTREPFGCESGPAPACSDGIDNDGSGLIDFPADPGLLVAGGQRRGLRLGPSCGRS